VNLPSGEVSSPTSQQPLTEAQLRQVHEQQQLFQQHLLNMQRHLLEQSQGAPATSPCQTSQMGNESEADACRSRRRAQPRRSPTGHETLSRQLDCDDDQAEIAALIERDPYFAAAMEDFVRSHGLLHDDRHRSVSLLEFDSFDR
jgi:hypothetical protein